MATHKAVSLMDLPPELRNVIYVAVFEGSMTTLSRTEETKKNRITYTASSDQTLKRLPGILQANSQIRFETMLLFYSTTELIATSAEALLAWLRLLDRSSKSVIKSVSLRKYISTLDKPEDEDHPLARILHQILLMQLTLAGLGSPTRFPKSRVRCEVWSEDGEQKLWPKG